MSIFITDEHNEYTQADGTAIDGFTVMEMPDLDADIFECETCGGQLFVNDFDFDADQPLFIHVTDLGCNDPQPRYF